MGVSSLRLGSSGAFEVERRGRCLTLESLSRSRVRVCIKLLTAPDFYRTPEKACLFPRRAERQTSTARTLSAGRCTVLQPPIGGLQLRGHTLGHKPRRRSGPGTSLCPQYLQSRRNFVHRSERRQVP